MSCAAGSRSSPGARGFTLFELLVVLAILALLAWVAVPRLASARGPSADLIGRDLVAALRDARDAALMQRRTAVFWLDLAGRSYGIEGAATRRLPADSHLAMWTVADRATATRGTVEFYPDGGASGGRILVERGGRRSLVTIDWLDGSVIRGE